MWTGEVALPSTGPQAASFLDVLRVRDFGLLWVAQTAAQLADKFLMFTLLIVLFSLTGRSSTQSLVMLAYTVPSILLSAPAGVIADRHDKGRVMIVTNLSRGALVLLIPLCLTTSGLRDQAWPLILITVLFSSVGQLFAPAEAASIPVLVRKDQIMIATSLFMTTVVATLVAGIPLATLAIRLLGRSAPFVVAAALFGVASLALLLMRTSLRAGPAQSQHPPSVLRELREGLLVLHGDAALRVGVGQLGTALVVIFTMFALGPAFISSELGRPPEDTYLLLIPATGGLVLSGIALGRRGARVRRARTIVLGAGSSGALLVASGLLPGWLHHNDHGELLTPLVIALGIGFGCSLGCLLILAFSCVQERTTESTRGRIFGGVFTVINAAAALPLLLAGSLADALGVSRVVVALGLLLLGYAALCRGPWWRALGLLDSAADHG